MGVRVAQTEFGGWSVKPTEKGTKLGGGGEENVGGGGGGGCNDKNTLYEILKECFKIICLKKRPTFCGPPQARYCSKHRVQMMTTLGLLPSRCWKVGVPLLLIGSH